MPKSPKESDLLPADWIVEVGARLRRERQRQGRTLQEVAQALGMDHSSLSTIERGRKPCVPLLTVARMAAALQLPLWTLFVPDPASRLLTLTAGFAEGRKALHERVAVAQQRFQDGHAQMVEAKLMFDEARHDHSAYVAQMRALMHDVS